MTKKSIEQDEGFIWKNSDIVYVVSYIDRKLSRDEKVVTAFNNLTEAKKYYAFCLQKYKCVQIDTCRVYDSYDKKMRWLTESDIDGGKRCSGKCGGL